MYTNKEVSELKTVFQIRASYGELEILDRAAKVRGTSKAALLREFIRSLESQVSNAKN